MSSAVQELLERVEKLTLEERRELIEALACTEEEARRRRVNEMFGKFGHVLSSSEDFLRRKHEDNEIEDRFGGRSE